MNVFNVRLFFCRAENIVHIEVKVQWADERRCIVILRVRTYRFTVGVSILRSVYQISHILLDNFFLRTIHISVATDSIRMLILSVALILPVNVATLFIVILLVHCLEYFWWLVPLLISLGNVPRAVLTIQVVTHEVRTELDIRHLLILPIEKWKVWWGTILGCLGLVIIIGVTSNLIHYNTYHPRTLYLFGCNDISQLPSTFCEIKLFLILDLAINFCLLSFSSCALVR